MFALLSEEDTDEPNGILVTFSVEQDDIEEFEEKAQEVYKHFKVLPRLISEDTTEPFELKDEVDFVIKGSNWGIINNNGGTSYYHDRDEAIAIMGQVAYPIDYSQFEGEDIEALLRSEVQIHFDIGELDITPSREALSYNDYTKRAIKETVECILLEMKEVIEESFDECETMFEARMKYYKLNDSGNVLNRVVGIFDKAEVTWNGVPLWSGDLAGLRLALPESLLEKDKPRNIFRDEWKVTVKAEPVKDIRFDHKKEMHFIFDDVKRGGIGRAKHYIKNLVGSEKYNSSNKDMAYLFTGGVTKEEVIEALECKESDLILTSTLPSPTKSSRSYYSGEARTKVALWDEKRGDWRDIEVDMSEGGFYVEINRYEIVNPSGSDGGRVHYTAAKIYDAMIELGYDFGLEEGEKPKIYGIKSQEVKKKKFNQDGNWTNLLEAAKGCYKDAEAEQFEWREDYNYWQKSDTNCGILNKIIPSMKNIPSVMTDYIDDCEAHDDRKGWVNAFCTIANVAEENSYDYYSYNCRGERNRDEVAEANPYPAKWEKVIKSYPMMELLLEELSSWGIEDKHVDAIIDYIKMVDRCGNIDKLLK